MGQNPYNCMFKYHSLMVVVDYFLYCVIESSNKVLNFYITF